MHLFMKNVLYIKIDGNVNKPSLQREALLVRQLMQMRNDSMHNRMTIRTRSLQEVSHLCCSTTAHVNFKLH